MWCVFMLILTVYGRGEYYTPKKGYKTMKENPRFRVKRVVSHGNRQHIYGNTDSYYVIAASTVWVVPNDIVEYEECGANFGLLVVCHRGFMGIDGAYIA